jgi:hypothetical protein
VIGGWKNPTSKGMVWQPARNAKTNRTERAVNVMDDSNSGATTNDTTGKTGDWGTHPLKPHGAQNAKPN